MRLIFIRHGQTPANVLGELDTAHPGPGLTALGTVQATQMAGVLREEPIDALYASTLVRTQLTAEPLSVATGLSVDVRPGLHEIEAGELERRSDRDSVRRYLETVFAWGLGELDARMPGGPDGHDFFGRFDADVAAVAASGADTAAVVSHGAAIRVWVAARAHNIAPSFAAENELDNTGIVVVEGSVTHGWRLTTWAGTPVAGHELADPSAEDPTGETLGNTLGEARS